MIVEKRGAVHLARWAVPVERKGQRQPAGLWAQFFLADIVCPAATALPDTTAEDQHVDHPTVVHVHVVPVVNTCAEDNHRAPMRFMGGIGKFTGDGFNILARHAGNLLTPGWGVRFDFSVIFRTVFIFQPAIEAVIRQYQIINADHRTGAAIG